MTRRPAAWAALALLAAGCGGTPAPSAPGEGGAGAAAPSCGDGVIDAGEACDDGAALPGDGCDAACAIEAGHACAGAPSHCLARWDVDVVAWIDALVPGLTSPGEGATSAPPTATREAFRASIDALFAGDWATAAARAPEAGYVAVALVDTAGPDAAAMAALVPSAWTPTGASGPGAGVYLVRGPEARAVAVSAPHPRYDLHTGHVAALAFRQLGLRAFALAGQHRCASPTESACSGTTSACGGGPFRISDAAHEVAAEFHEAHLAAHAAGLLALQVHGTGSTATAASISDGTTTDRTEAGHLGNRLRDALAAALGPAGAAPGSCNRAGDDDFLCATTNVQGRVSNGVDAGLACTTSSQGAATGRFLHVELAADLRDDEGAVGPATFVTALGSVLP